MNGEWQGMQPGTPPPRPGPPPTGAVPNFTGGADPVSPIQYAEPVFPAPVFPGQAPLPQEVIPLGPPLPERGGSRKPLLIVAAVIVALLAIGGVTFAVSSGDDDTNAASSGKRSAQSLAAGGSPIVPCASPPGMSVTGFRRDGHQFIASISVSAGCADGDILSSSATRVAISDSGSNVAAATFDFAAKPIVLPRSGDAPVALELCFNPPDYWRLPDSVSTSGAQVVVEKLGQVGGPSQADPADVVDSVGRVCASGAALPQTGDAESASSEGLQAMRTTDVARIRALGADKWVPQVSTKQPGLFYDNIVWNFEQILGEQYYFRERYRETALLWTGDFRSYNDPNWWGSVVLIPFSNSQGALAWCAQQGMDKDHCFAKRVNATGTQGSNEYQP
ncbi:hypothetical protein [Antrihabitans stalactiti]|uniref:Uncharacterized protein n=1 Tax=Antrihabitans stalactiti TaxID=2584121 RepID=A0A848KFS3_9NOCA|nr:hypothetical protein [Antrihabitans stalactiti]NMN95060.1 hypothetical protein [Antrihabitans stalactiti]